MKQPLVTVLEHEQIVALKNYLEQITIGELLQQNPNLAPALHRIYKACINKLSYVDDKGEERG